jgi:hypothetical protein
MSYNIEHRQYDSKIGNQKSTLLRLASAMGKT